MNKILILIFVTVLVSVLLVTGNAEAKHTSAGQGVSIHINVHIQFGRSPAGNTPGTSSGTSGGVARFPGSNKHNDVPRPYPVPDKKSRKIEIKRAGKSGKGRACQRQKQCRKGGKSPDRESETEVLTRKIGSGPILEHYIKRMGVVSIIDRMVPSHMNRKISHGEAVAALMIYTLNNGRALYRMEKWAEDTAILNAVFPDYQPGDWTDDRLGDTLEALYKCGLEGIQGSVSVNVIKEFGLDLSQIHYDPTSVSLWGTYDAETGQPAIVITFGYSKAHRSDLKQVVVGAAVTGDGGVPIISGTHDGNTSDSVLPVSYWERLRQVTDKSSFCFIGDCKMASEENMGRICSKEGKILATMPMTTSEQKNLTEKIKSGELKFGYVDIESEEKLRPVYEKLTDRPGNRKKKEPKEPDTYESWEESLEIKDDKGEAHTLRKLVIRSGRLSRLKALTRERHMEKAEKEFKSLCGRLNKYKLKTHGAIEAAANNVLADCKVKNLMGFAIEEKKEVVRKKVGRGKPGPNSKYTKEEKVTYGLKFWRKKEAIEEKALLDGIFLMVTNQDAENWPVSRMLSVYKQQFKVERNFSVLKGPLAVSPMLLEKSEKICSMMFVMTLTLQLYTLIQRQAALEIAKRNFPLEGLMPNRIRTWRPQTDKLLAAFDNINLVEFLNDDGSSSHVTSLNALQTEILQLIGVPVKKYASEAFFLKSGET